ncbi:MAG TPA: ATP-binding protein, partial [Caulobacteraceae bacterium]|nr:ATP-binding protein [Caulobacteraceae bacterium]
MFKRFDWGFDSRFDLTASSTRARAPQRVLLATAVAVVAAVNASAAPALAWWALSLLSELWVWRASGPAFVARANLWSRLERLAAVFTNACVWVLIGFVLWQGGTALNYLLTFAIFAGVLMYTVQSCYRIPIHLIVCSAPPIFGLLVLPLGLVKDLPGLFTAVVSMLLLAGFSMMSALSAYRSHRKLLAATAELIERREAAESASHAKTEFLATMSHEIRTPLNGVLGMAQAMEKADLCPEQRERLSVIRQSGETLFALLNDILDLSKIEAGKFVLEDGLVRIEELTRGAEAVFRPLAEAKGVAFRLEVEPSAAGAWKGDPTRVRQILYNLIANAVKFTDRGEVRVRLSAEDGALRFQVADTGVGIAEDKLPLLFERFVQADTSTTRRFGGTGLGLAITQELVKAIGGDIDADSILGVGTTFTVRLRMTRAAAERAETPARPEPAAEPAQLRILAAEDNPTNQVVISTLLTQLGLDVHLVSTGQQAIEAWQAQPWDLILMDVQMPVMDGPTAARTIRRLEQQGARRRT